MINELRISNLQKQVKSINKNRLKQPKAVYQERDSVTGKRLIRTALSGFVLIDFLSNSQPNSVADSIDYNQKTSNQKPALPKDRPL